MLHHRMATNRSIFTLLWFLIVTSVCAQDVVLPVLRPEVARFLPLCARQCFRSFLAVNYGLNPCGRLPSLQCLCQRLGSTGFTASEGSLQCVIAERDVGSCSPIEANDAAVRRAFTICDGIEEAVQPTHSVITATVVVPPSGSGPVTVPPPQTTTRSNSSSRRSTRSRTRTSTDTTSAPPASTDTSSSVVPTSRSGSRTSSLPSTLVTATSSTSTTTGGTNAESPTVAPPQRGSDSKKDDDDDDLNTGQVVGISVGVAAAAAVAIGAIFLARYYRKKKYPDVKTGFFPTRDTWGYNVEKRPGSDSNPWLTRTAPDGGGPGPGSGAGTSTPDPLPIPPPAYSRQTWRPTGANAPNAGASNAPSASPASTQRRKATQTTPSRRTSRLLPAKPVLALALPKQSPSPSSTVSQPRASPAANSPGRPSPARNSPGGRFPVKPQPLPPKEKQSQTTKPSAAAAAAAAATASSSSRPRAAPAQLRLQIPKLENPLPPLPLAQHRRESTMTEFEEDGRSSSMSPNGQQIWSPPSAGPLSAMTVYIADKNGNWVLSGPRGTSHVAELDGSATSPNARPPLPQQSNPERPRSGAPSPESKGGEPQRSLAPAAEIKSASDRARLPRETYAAASDANVPRPLFSSGQVPRRSSRRQSSSRTVGRPRAESTDSGVTTICTSPEDATPAMELPMSTPLGPPTSKQPFYLSPVVESPKPANEDASTAAAAQFSPKGPGRLKDAAAVKGLNILPPQTRNRLYSPPGQPSPTLGLMQPGQKKQDTTTPGPRQPLLQNPGLVRTGSPTLRMVRASPEADDRTYLPSAQPSRASQQMQRPPQQPQQQYPQQSFYSQQQQPQQYPYGQEPYRRQQPYMQQPQQQQRPIYPYRPPPQQQGRRPPYPSPYYPQQQQRPPPSSFRPQQSRRGPHPLSNVSNYPSPLRPSFPVQPPLSSQQQPTEEQLNPLPPPQAGPVRAVSTLDLASPSSERTASTASSLLAKRVGFDRAADMAIPADSFPSGAAAARWRRDPDFGGPGYDPSTPPRFQRDYPPTPTWEPRLTPTRRGDDLFLDVR